MMPPARALDHSRSSAAKERVLARREFVTAEPSVYAALSTQRRRTIEN